MNIPKFEHMFTRDLLKICFPNLSKNRVDTIIKDTAGLYSCSSSKVSKGITKRMHINLLAHEELQRRFQFDKLKKSNLLKSPQEARKYVALKLRNYEREVFACIFLDNQHHVIAFEELFFGTIDGASVHPRIVVERVLHHNAAAVILVHNHPSGYSEPSHADRRITEELKNALALIDVRVLDHFVVGDQVFSFSEKNLI